jgi:DNA-binding XRE family transcriptional regulator
MSKVSSRIELGTVLEQSISTPPPYLARDIGSRFGVRLRDLRRSHRLTQLDMAITFGIDRSYISDVECGKKGISLATLEIIALGFSMKLSDLFENL